MNKALKEGWGEGWEVPTRKECARQTEDTLLLGTAVSLIRRSLNADTLPFKLQPLMCHCPTKPQLQPDLCSH